MENGKNLIVLRFERASTYDLGGIEAHGKRKGDVPHVDRDRTRENEFLIGNPNLRGLADQRVRDLMNQNIETKRASLLRRRRKSDLDDLDAAVEAANGDTRELSEIIGWPWDAKNTKPWTEGILSASHDWFHDDAGNEDPSKVSRFPGFATAYLQHEFGDEVIYARADRDEKTVHVSFVVAPEHVEKRTKRAMLSHHSHRLFGQVEKLVPTEKTATDDEEQKAIWVRKSYELFQDRVAQFAHDFGLDLQRGKKRAENERQLRALGQHALKRENVPPARARELAEVIAGVADKKLKQADTILSRADSREASAKEREVALDRGMEAVEARELDYVPATKKREEGLRFGPNAPEKETARDKLKAAVMPAYNAVIGFAKRIFRMRQKEEELERKAAEMARRARLVADEKKRMGEAVSTSLRDVVRAAQDGAAPRGIYTPTSFPGTWQIQRGESTETIDRTLRETTNAQLSRGIAATQDAYLLCEDQKDLRDDYGRGLRVLAYEASARGLDIETGRHDPAKAADPARGQLHVDTPEPVKIKRRIQERQLVR